jgi:hypothetical protein
VLSDEILVPPDELCAECGLPYGDAVHTGDADADDEARERAETERAVAARVEEKLAEAKAIKALVARKMAVAKGEPQTVPAPRTDSLDQLEMARIGARDFEARVNERVAQKMQEAHVSAGTAAFVQVPGHVAHARSAHLAFETRDAGVIETRDVELARARRRTARGRE